MPVWVKIRRIPLTVNEVIYKPGDWAEIASVGYATRLVADDRALILDYSQLLGDDISALNIGIVSDNDFVNILKLPVAHNSPQNSPFERTIYLAGTPQKVKPKLNGLVGNPARLIAALKLLDKWEMAVPLLDYERMAIHRANEAQESYIRPILRDLRVPLYNPATMVYRLTDTTRELFTRWHEHESALGDGVLAFLCAYYETKPFLRALPPTWA